MKIAVLTLCRDRLDYTKHCVQSLRDNAGCEYDHYMLDQASTDETWDWMCEQPDLKFIESLPENIGVSAGLNYLIERFDTDYDVVAHFDNDCEVVTPNCLRDLAQLVHDGGAILSPRILGLEHPPEPLGKARIGDEPITKVAQVGGIFLTTPGWVYDEFRYSPEAWKYDDVEICHWWWQHGGTVGYVERLQAWHYETNVGQRQRYPDYFARADEEYTTAWAALQA